MWNIDKAIRRDDAMWNDRAPSKGIVHARSKSETEPDLPLLYNVFLVLLEYISKTVLNRQYI